QPSRHPGTPRVAQSWMGLSDNRDGAARCFARCPPLVAFWADFSCCGDGMKRSPSHLFFR
ncbi:unnamed protein product, partial [Musa textilis]